MEFTDYVKQRNAGKPISSLCDLELVMGTDEQRRAFHQKISRLQKEFPRIQYSPDGYAHGADESDDNALPRGKFLPGIPFLVAWSKTHYPYFTNPGSAGKSSPGVQENLDRLSKDEKMQRVTSAKRHSPSSEAVKRALKKLSDDGGIKEIEKLNATLKAKKGETTMKTFEQAVVSYMENGETRGAAVRKAVHNHPKLYQDYLDRLRGDKPSVPAESSSQMFLKSMLDQRTRFKSFEEAVEGIKKSSKVSKAKAVSIAVAKFPSLHEDYIKRVNGAQ